MDASLHGVVLADKPAGASSHDIVARARRAVGRRVGHAGTLDPFATGLLLLLIGRATRLQRFLMALPKTYDVVARLGATSTTGDPEGEITETGAVPDELVLPTGPLQQRPPAYSAVKVGGERAYRRARRGEQFELAERAVHVYEFELQWREADHAGLRVVCSAGTYVRSLVAALGDAYCVELRRTAIGHFQVTDAEAPVWPAEGSRQIGGSSPRVMPIGEALSFMPTVRLSEDEARRASHGVAVALPDGLEVDPGEALGPVLLVDDEAPIAVAEPRQTPAGLELKPIVGLRD